MQDRLFRRSALDKLASPEQLDQLMQVTTPRGWLIALGLGILMAVALLWGIFGSIPQTVAGQGILIRGNGIQTVEALGSGQITHVAVREGDSLAAGQVVATLHLTDQDKEVPVFSTQAGRVLELRVNEGNIVQAGTPLLSLEQTDQPMRVVLYVSLVDGKKLQPGMTVHISPSTVRKDEFGVMLGSVVSVGDFPVTSQGMLRVLGSDELIRALPQGGVSIEVVVEPTIGGTTSGYQWSSSGGPPITLASGTFCTADIVIAEQRPISLIFAG